MIDKRKISSTLNKHQYGSEPSALNRMRTLFRGKKKKGSDEFSIGFKKRYSKSNYSFLKYLVSAIVIICMLAYGFMCFLPRESRTTRNSKQRSNRSRQRSKRRNGMQPKPVRPTKKASVPQTKQSSTKSDVSYLALSDFLKWTQSVQYAPFGLHPDDKSVMTDKKMNVLITTHCVERLPIHLDLSALSTLNAHMEYLIESLSTKQKLPDVHESAMVVTKTGTIIDMQTTPANKKLGKEDVDYSFGCSLLKSIIIKSKELGLNDPKIRNHFVNSNENVWNENKKMLDSNDLNRDAWNIISFATEERELNDYEDHLHVAHQVAPQILESHCPHVMKFLRERGKGENGQEAILEAAHSAVNLLVQLYKKGEIELDNHEIAGFDTNGYIVAFSEFDEDLAHRDDYETCSLIDKIVYYRNTNIADQAVNALAALKENNVFAFEAKMDILMEQHCSNVVNRLQRKEHHGDNVHDAIFRGELLSFATVLLERPEWFAKRKFVIGINGGILIERDARRKHDEGDIFECSLVTEMVRNAGMAHFGSKKSNSGKAKEEIKESEFDPDAEDKMKDALKFMQDQLNNKIKKDPKTDAKIIFYTSEGKERKNLRRVIYRMLKLYHGEFLGENMDRDKMDKLVTEIEQFVVALIDDDPKIKWPKEFKGIIDRENARILIHNASNKKDMEHLQRNKELAESPLITALFEVHHEVEEKNSLDRFNIDDLLEPWKKQQRDNEMKNEAKEKKDEPAAPKQQRVERKENVQQNDNSKDADLQRYIGLVWDDIKRNDINSLSGDIYRDLDKYCNNVLTQLSSYSVKQFKMNLMKHVGEIKNGVNMKDRFANPVIVVNDGSIMATNSVDQHQQFLNCPYVTYLLSYKP